MNRTLKRPMFRIGGPVNQGSGIMSHVEPRRVHRATGGRIGFAIGTIPGFQNQVVTPQDESGLDILLRNYGANNLDIQQSGLNSLRRDTTNTEDTGESTYTPTGSSQFDRLKERLYNPFQNIKLNPKGIQSGILEKMKYGKGLDTARSQSKLYDSGINTMEGPDRPATIEKKEPEYTDTTKTDPKESARDSIRKESALIKELLHGEDYQDMSKGEVALVLARALAEPGPIGNKLKVASELSIPLIKAKKGEDKEAVLEAYKAYREREKAEIMAGKDAILAKNAKAMTDAHMAANKNEKRTYAEVYNDIIGGLASGESKLSEKVKAAAFSGLQQTLETKVNLVRKTEADIAAGKKLSKSELETHEDNKNYVRSMKERFPEYFTSIYGNKLAKGGRVKLADGTEDPDTTTEDGTTTDDTVESTTTSEDAGTPQTQLKPVVKLSFQELRSRLPKEITNDIVGMLASSEEALQDFAYIKTQQDVNNFNVKYGVNLVLPSNR